MTNTPFDLESALLSGSVYSSLSVVSLQTGTHVNWLRLNLHIFAPHVNKQTNKQTRKQTKTEREMQMRQTNIHEKKVTYRV